MVGMPGVWPGFWALDRRTGGGVPKKGVNRANKDLFPICYLKFRDRNLRFLAFSGGPGGFRELREAGRNHFHLS